MASIWGNSLDERQVYYSTIQPKEFITTKRRDSMRVGLCLLKGRLLTGAKIHQKAFASDVFNFQNKNQSHFKSWFCCTHNSGSAQILDVGSSVLLW
ncbi:hypothetical protein HI914_06733 [Erysiphe necator]|nr:hypothetical protein HI914_06733 [Erysiphe necator]